MRTQGREQQANDEDGDRTHENSMCVCVLPGSGLVGHLSSSVRLSSRSSPAPKKSRCGCSSPGCDLSLCACCWSREKEDSKADVGNDVISRALS